LDDLPIWVFRGGLVSPKLLSNAGAQADETLIIHARLDAMHPAACCIRIALGLLCLLVWSTRASAQTGGYIAGTLFADVKQFVYFESTSRDGFYDSTNNSATTGGGAFRVGGWLHPNVTLEIGAGASATTTVDAVDATSISFGPIGGIVTPPPQFDLKASTQYTTVTVAVGFHPATDRRVRFGYLVGYALVRGTEKSDYTEQEILPPTFSRLPGYFKATRTLKRNAGAFVMGVEAAATLTSRLALAPEIRVLTFSGTFLIRPASACVGSSDEEVGSAGLKPCATH